jgi:hypothetical protein
MKLKTVLLQVAVTTVFIGAGSMQASAAKCVMAGGLGTGITPEIAKLQAGMALNTSISNMGAKARGKVATTCETALVVSSCTSRQRACK